MAIFDFFKRQQGGKGGAGGSMGDPSGTGSKSGEYIPKGNARAALGGGVKPTNTIEGKLPATIKPTIQAVPDPNAPNFTRVGESYKGSMFSNSTDLVAKGKGLAVTEQPIQGIKQVTPSLEGSVGRGLKSALTSRLAGTALAVAPEAYSTASDISNTDDASLRAGRVGEGALKVASTLAGAQAGASLGATAGSVVPGVGNVVGGAVGGLIGGGLGYFAPQAALDTINKVSGNNYKMPSQLIAESQPTEQSIAQPISQAKLADAPTTFQNASKAEMTVPTESQKLGSVVNDRVQQGEFGQAGGVKYALDDAGKVIRQDSSGSKYLQSRVSSMGPNGSTVSRELRPNEVTALDRSKQMISDWKDYKEEQQFKNLISGRPASSQLSAIAVRNADLTDRAQIAANSENQRLGRDLEYRQAAMTASKNAFDQQKDLHTLSREDAKAASEIEGRLQNQRVEGLKLFSKAAESNQPVSTQLGLLRNASGGKLDPSILRSAYSDNLKGVTSRAGAIDALKDADISPEDFDQLIRLFQE